MTDSTLEAFLGEVREHTSSLKVALHTPDWPSFRKARRAAIEILGEPEHIQRLDTFAYLWWRVGHCPVELWTPQFRAPNTQTPAPPNDLDELLAVPDAN